MGRWPAAVGARGAAGPPGMFIVGVVAPTAVDAPGAGVPGGRCRACDGVKPQLGHDTAVGATLVPHWGQAGIGLFILSQRSPGSQFNTRRLALPPPC
jgi:hypothetical protein